MTTVWTCIGIVAVVAAAIKAAGPLIVGGKPLPLRAQAIIVLLAPALLTALVIVDTFADGKALVLDARAAGLAGAALSLALRAPLLVVVLVAAGATAGVRALG